jgi:outer membrane protein assembly factor BamB
LLTVLTCLALVAAGTLIVDEPHADAVGVSSAGFVALTSARLLDTRAGTGAPAHPVAPNSTLALQVTGRAGVPTTGVSAVVLNVTVTSPATPGWVSAYPDGSARPSTSNLNFSAGQTVPNLVIVPVGSNGSIDLYNGSNGTVNLLADITGYYQGGAENLNDSPGRSFQGDIGHSGVLTGISLTPPLIPAWATGGFDHPGQAIFGAGAIYVPSHTPETGQPIITALRESDGSILWGPQPIPGAEGLAYDAGRVFAVDFYCALHSYDATAGTAQWATKNFGEGCNSPPTAANGIVYFGTNTQLIAVSESTGAIVWTAAASADHSSPGVVNGKVIVDPTDLLVSAFDASTGAPAWHYDGLGEGGGGRVVAIAGGRVYARSTSSGMTKIFNADTGTVLGTIASDGPTAVDAPNDVIITQKQSVQLTGCGINPCSLVARSLDTGAELWTFAGDGVLSGPPLIVDGVVYVTGFTGNIYGLDEMTGALVWSATVHDYVMPFDEQNAPQEPSLNAADGLLTVSSTSGVHAFKTSSRTDVAPIQHFYSGITQATCSESAGPFTVPSCTWDIKQTYAGSDVMHLIFNPAYKVALSADFLDSSDNTLATVTTLSGDAYLTTPNLPAGGTYRLRVRGPVSQSIGFKMYFSEAQPHTGSGPTALFSATTLPFDSVPVGSRRSQSLTIRNVGDQDLTLGNATLGGTGVAAFSIDFNSCNEAVLPPSSACTIVVSAHPATQTSSIAALTISHGASSQDVDLSVSGYQN